MFGWGGMFKNDGCVFNGIYKFELYCMLQIFVDISFFVGD